jgi:uncharacterized membrane protein YdcZ (DUF606 family)
VVRSWGFGSSVAIYVVEAKREEHAALHAQHRWWDFGSGSRVKGVGFIV